VIQYHGGPVSGSRTDNARFYMGRHAFVSFAAPDHLPAIADVAESFALDNGAFTAWRAGETFDRSGYIDWVEQWHRHPAFDWAVIPDVIDGSEEENDELIAAWPPGLRGVPVYHLHESMRRLQDLAWRYGTVALGSSGQWSTPGTQSWWARMEEVMRCLCNEAGQPQCRLHGLRMLAPAIIDRLPLSSADSCNAAINAGSLSRFGQYVPPSASQRAEVIALRMQRHNAPAVWRPMPQQYGMAFDASEGQGQEVPQ
jgi:hypothetical protein